MRTLVSYMSWWDVFFWTPLLILTTCVYLCVLYTDFDWRLITAWIVGHMMTQMYYVVRIRRLEDNGR